MNLFALIAIQLTKFYIKTREGIPTSKVSTAVPPSADLLESGYHYNDR